MSYRRRREDGMSNWVITLACLLFCATSARAQQNQAHALAEYRSVVASQVFVDICLKAPDAPTAIQALSSSSVRIDPMPADIAAKGGATLSLRTAFNAIYEGPESWRGWAVMSSEPPNVEPIAAPVVLYGAFDTSAGKAIACSVGPVGGSLARLLTAAEMITKRAPDFQTEEGLQGGDTTIWRHWNVSAEMPFMLIAVTEPGGTARGKAVATLVAVKLLR
jgi:hypothetical protein